MASIYDDLLGIQREPVSQNQGSNLVPANLPVEAENLIPGADSASVQPASGSASASGEQALRSDQFLRVDQFFGLPEYQRSDYFTKKALEKEYASTFLSPERMKAAGATAAQQTEAIQFFRKNSAKDPRKDDSIFDTDLLDIPAAALARGVSGAARVLGFDEFADRAAADAKSIEETGYSATTRLKNIQEQRGQAALEKRYGGEENVPWWEEVKKAVGDFGAQPINKVLGALGSGAPALAAAIVPGGAGISLSVLASSLLTAGDAAGGAYDKIMGMTEQQLNNSIEYRALREGGLDHETAKTTAARQAVLRAAGPAAVLGAAAGAAGLRFGAEGLVRDAATGTAGRRIAGETLQETGEEGLTQGIQNYAVQPADPSQGLTTGVAGAAAAGGLAGGGMAAGVAALSGSQAPVDNSQPQNTPAPAPVTPTTLPTPVIEELRADATRIIQEAGDRLDNKTLLDTIVEQADKRLPGVSQSTQFQEILRGLGIDPRTGIEGTESGSAVAGTGERPVDSGTSGTETPTTTAGVENGPATSARPVSRDRAETVARIAEAQAANPDRLSETGAVPGLNEIDRSIDGTAGRIGETEGLASKQPGFNPEATPADIEAADPAAYTKAIYIGGYGLWNQGDDAVYYHPKKNTETGEVVKIAKPTKDTPQETGVKAVYIPSLDQPAFFQGSHKWDHATWADNLESENLLGNRDVNGVPAGSPAIKYAGIIAHNSLGDIVIVEPSNHYKGRTGVLPIGHVDRDSTDPRVDALREAYEEAGIKAKLRNTAPIILPDGTAYWEADLVGDVDAGSIGWETQAVKIADRHELKNLLNSRTALQAAKEYNRFADSFADVPTLAGKYSPKKADPSAQISWEPETQTKANNNEFLVDTFAFGEFELNKVAEKPGGSNLGYIAEDSDGKRWLVKHGGNSATEARKFLSEWTAAKVFKAIHPDNTPEVRQVLLEDGSIGIAYQWYNNLIKLDPNNETHKAQARQLFITNAFLGNWDAVGLNYDNVGFNMVNGTPIQLDLGGSLEYRAQGEPKEYGWQVKEFSSLLDMSVNPQAATVYAGLTDGEQIEQIQNLRQQWQDAVESGSGDVLNALNQLGIREVMQERLSHLGLIQKALLKVVKAEKAYQQNQQQGLADLKATNPEAKFVASNPQTNDLPLPASIIADIASANPTAALQKIIDNPPNQIAKAIAERLIKVAGDVNTRIQNTSTGLYQGMWAFTDTQAGRKRGMVNLYAITKYDGFGGIGKQVFPSYHAFLHEMAHALTAYALINPKNPTQVAARQNLVAIMKRVDAETAADDPIRSKVPLSGFKTVEEFVAEVYSNYEFQQHLKGMTAAKFNKAGKNKSLWNSILDVIAKLFGTNNVLAQSILQIENLSPELHDNTNTVKAIGLLKAPPRKKAEKGVKPGPDEIVVNGAIYPRTNSVGEPIAATDAEIRAFYEWFGDSHAVDSKGRPKVLYRSADPNAGVAKTNHPGIFFSDVEAVSETYGNGKMYKAYLRLSSPYYIEGQGNTYSAVPVPFGALNTSANASFSTDQFVKGIKRKGGDGTIHLNVQDAGSGTHGWELKEKGINHSNIYVTYSGNNIWLVGTSAPVSAPEVLPASTTLPLENIDAPANQVSDYATRSGPIIPRGQVRGSAAEVAGERSGQNNRGLPDAGAAEGAGNGTDGQDSGNRDSAGENLARISGQNTVVEAAIQSVFKLNPEHRLNLEHAAASVGLPSHVLVADLAERATFDQAPQVDDNLQESFNIAVAGTVLALPTLQQTSQKIKTAFDQATSGTTDIKDYDEWLKALADGDMPQVSKLDNWWSKLRERYVDSTTPLLRMLKFDQENPIWRAFKLGGSKLQEQNRVLNEELAQLNFLVNREAKKLGMSVSEYFYRADQFTLARYVAEGANNELRVSHENRIQSLEKLRNDLQASNPQWYKNAALISKVNAYDSRIVESQNWLAMYADIDGKIRGKDTDASGNIIQRLPSHKFIGGLTTAEAKEGIRQLSKFGPDGLASFQLVADNIVQLQQRWSQRAIDSGLYNPDEVMAWPSRQFAETSGKYYVPTTGETNTREDYEDIDLYRVGGQIGKDHSREGRVSIAHGAYMTTLRQVSSLARRIAYKDFQDTLYNTASGQNPYGLYVVRQDTPTPDSPRTFAYKTYNSVDGTERWKIAFQDQAAIESIIGANRHELENSLLKGFSSFTRGFGFLVTQATLMFGPINSFRDFGEKAYSLVARHTDVPKGRFLAAATAEYVNPANFTAAFQYAFGKTSPSQHWKDLKELADLGGLNTRTGSINREADKIVGMIRRQSPGFRELGKLKDAIGKYNEAFEMVASLAVYRALKATTSTPIDVQAFRVLDVMNFNQSGTLSPILRSFYLFFNPTVQGARNTYETLIKDITKNTPAGRRKRVMALGAMLGAATLYSLARELGGDDEDYGNRTDALATATVGRTIPIWVGDTIIKIPVPFGSQSVLWNLAVGAIRYATGAASAGDAAMHILQGAAEHTVPFPLSRVDLADDPAFWFIKTLTPQILGPILNVAAGKNDFGTGLVNPYLDQEKPDFVQGKKKTDQAWKDIARTLAENGGGDFLPEHISELSRLLFAGPLEGVLRWAIDVQVPEGDPSHLERILGVNRVYASDTRGVVRAYYEAEKQANELTRQVFLTSGEKPKIRGKQRQAAIEQWIANSDLSVEDQQRVLLSEEFDDKLRKIKRGGATAEEEQQLMREFLRQYRAIAQ